MALTRLQREILAVVSANRNFSGPRPDIALLSREWKQMLLQAKELISLLPVETVGTCVLDSGGAVFRGGTDTLREQLKKNAVLFHRGSIRGAFPVFPEAKEDGYRPGDGKS